MGKYTLDEIKAMTADIRKQLEEECAGLSPDIRPLALLSAVVAREEVIAAIARLQKEELILCDLRATTIRAKEETCDAFHPIPCLGSLPDNIDEIYLKADDKAFQMGRFAKELSKKCDCYMEHIKTAKAILCHFICSAETCEIATNEWQREILYWYNVCMTATVFCDAVRTYSEFVITCEKHDRAYIENQNSFADKQIPNDLLEEELRLSNLTKEKNAEEEQARLRLNQLREDLGGYL